MPRRLARRIKAFYRAASASLAWRLVLGAAGLITVALAVAAVALPQLYRSGLERQFDSQLDHILYRLITRITVERDQDVTLGEPVTEQDFESAYSGFYWQIAIEGKVILASRSLAGYALALPRPKAVRSDVHYDAAFPQAVDGPQDLRVVTRTVPYESIGKDLVYSVAANRHLLDQNVADFRLTTVLVILGLGMVLVGTVFLQVRYGLRPIRRIPEALSAIRSGETDRLTGSFSAEVEPLAREINALLDHNAAVVDRARTHVGNLAHALKTPIAVLTNEAAGRAGDFAQTVAGQVGIMKEQVEHHLSRARLAARAGARGARTSATPPVEGRARTLEKN
jgi:signal transduction histidine kinase